MVYGYVKDIEKYDAGHRDQLLGYAAYLSKIFTRNYELCMQCDVSIVKLIAELHSIYGLKVSKQVMYGLKTGKRFKCGFTLIMCLRDYWSKRGMFLDLN